MRKETRAAVADRQNRLDTRASNAGQSEARRYLQSKEQEAKKSWMPDLLDTVLFCITMAALAVFLFSL
jgi:hypothetical protein